ncbi:hypothetical protein GCM10011506_12810 [Marivirga lumbricoides]|uniref:DUF3127 domain-containing protein n=1 Tax=Marivirga lumbricoides TaxID=1046115 RepID=A0ABQ1LYN8_9BACT|nr:hypothetical protein GCM10011506_12810 [Marivirga lumbricoides]
MELTGKVIDVLEEEKGNGRNGEWRKQSFVIETQEQYPKKVCAVAWGDKIDSFNIKKGEELTAKINIESREYNGKWYTDVKIWAVERGGSQGSTSSAGAPSSGAYQSQAPMGQGMSGPQDAPPPSEDDELPF